MILTSHHDELGFTLLNDLVRHHGIAYSACDKNFLCCIDDDSLKKSFQNQNKVLSF